MAKFRTKRMVIDAIQVTGNNQAQALKLAYPDLSKDALKGAQIMKLPVVIVTPAGETTVAAGDWIVRDQDGELHVCGRALFAATYEFEPD
jgi:hypothetical protein